MDDLIFKHNQKTNLNQRKTAFRSFYFYTIIPIVYRTEKVSKFTFNLSVNLYFDTILQIPSIVDRSTALAVHGPRSHVISRHDARRRRIWSTLLVYLICCKMITIICIFREKILYFMRVINNFPYDLIKYILIKLILKWYSVTAVCCHGIKVSKIISYFFKTAI